MPRSYKFRKCPAGYKLHQSQEKINHLVYMDDIKRFAKNEKKKWEALIQAVRIYSDDLEMRFGIENMCHAYNEKRKTTNDGRNRTTK